MITNVSAASGYTSTLHLYDISTPTEPVPITVATPTAVSAMGMAIDAGNGVSFLTQDVPATTATYHSCAPPNYACAVVGPSGGIPGGQWLAFDGLGNAFATQLSGANSGVVRFNASTGPTATSLIYTSANAPGAYYGLVVSGAASTLYVTEGPSNAVNGVGVTIHACNSPCPAGGTDITAALRTSMGSNTANFSGALGISGLGDLVVGLSNTSGSSNPAGTSQIAIVCSSPNGTTFACQSTAFLSAAFTGVSGLSPWDGTAAIALDPSFNVYTAAFLRSGGSTAPAPSINAYADGDTFQPFSCGITTGTPAVPDCPINQLPGPPAYTQGALPAPYSMAATGLDSL